MKIVNCKLNHKINPVGYHFQQNEDGTYQLSFSWIVEEVNGTCTKQANVYVATDESFENVVFDSGVLEGQSGVCYRVNIKLEPYTRYYWKVCAESNIGEVSESEGNFFETAKLKDEWKAQWIGTPEKECTNPVFTKTIVVDEQITDARIYMTCQGVYEVYVNGEKCGNEFLAPGCTNYNRWLQYQTYEVGLQKGENQIEITVGNGWFNGRFGLSGHKSAYANEPGIIAEIRQGDHLLDKTDETWSVRTGAVKENGIYDGEVYKPQKDCGASTSVKVLPDMKAILCERMSLPIIVKETRKPIEVLTTPIGETVLDFGQNMSGFVSFDADEPEGTTIRLQYGEVLQDGCFYRDNYRTAKAEYIYVSDGRKHQIRPKFTYFGFRYVKVEGLTKPVASYDFIANTIYSDLEQKGQLETGNDKVNQLISNALWGQKSNYVDVPTDCPQRDEKLGWTGDTQIFSATACFQMDSYAFLEKFARDLYETQLEKGFVTNVIPPFEVSNPTCAAWGDAATIIPWNLYLYYGDKSILEEQFESMKNWAEYMHAESQKGDRPYLWFPEDGFGDWLAQDHENPKERMAGGTELAYISTAYYYYSTNLVAKAAKVLGKKTEENEYSERAEKIRQAFTEEYYTRTGRLAVTTQAAYAIALYMGLDPESAEERTAFALHEKLEQNQGYLKTGFVGTPYIMQALSKHGYHADACQILLNEQAPSWLYAVNLGATTIWERWNSMLEDGHVNGTDMNSFNHYSYGAVVEWMYRYLAGIKPIEEYPGFTKVRIQPMPCRKLKHLHMSYQSAAGTYEIQWEYRADHQFYVKVVVPFDAEATLILPFADKAEIQLASGTYEYTYERAGEQEEEINTYMSFGKLRSIPEVQNILEKYFPEWASIPDTFCKDSLRNMSKTPFVNIEDAVMDQMDAEMKELNQ